MANQKEIDRSSSHTVQVESYTDVDVKGDKPKSEKISMFQICEVLLLTPVMVIIIGLFLFPTILYASPPAEVRIIKYMHA